MANGQRTCRVHDFVPECASELTVAKRARKFLHEQPSFAATHWRETIDSSVRARAVISIQRARGGCEGALRVWAH